MSPTDPLPLCVRVSAGGSLTYRNGEGIAAPAIRPTVPPTSTKSRWVGLDMPIDFPVAAKPQFTTAVVVSEASVWCMWRG